MHLLFWILVIPFFWGFGGSCPPGPLNILAFYRGFRFGWRHTLLCGLGSAVMDTSWCTIMLLAGRELARSIDLHAWEKPMTGVISVALICLGVYYLKSGPGKNSSLEKQSSKSSHYGWDLLAGVLLVAPNPGTIGYWMSFGGLWALHTASHPAAIFITIPLVFAGCISWFALLAALTFHARKIGQEKLMSRISFLAGGIFIALGVLGLVSLLF